MPKNVYGISDFMKNILTLLFVCCFSAMSIAQTTTNSSKKEATPKTYNIVTPGSYEANIVIGKIIINKIQVKEGNTSAYTSRYTLVIPSDKPEGKDKIVEMKLSRQFFESVFLKATPDLSAKSAELTKYVIDRNMHLNDEKDWVSVVKYYNSL